MSHFPNNKQREAFAKVEFAIKAAQKAGLIFYAKADNLVAYTKEANTYIEQFDFMSTQGTGQEQVPNLSKLGLLADAGGDDYACYMSPADQLKHYDNEE